MALEEHCIVIGFRLRVPSMVEKIGSTVLATWSYLSIPCQSTAVYPDIQVGATRKSAKASHSINCPLTMRRNTSGWSVVRSLSQYPPYTYICCLHFKGCMKYVVYLLGLPVFRTFVSPVSEAIKHKDDGDLTKQLQSYTESCTNAPSVKGGHMSRTNVVNVEWAIGCFKQYHRVSRIYK